MAKPKEPHFTIKTELTKTELLKRIEDKLINPPLNPNVENKAFYTARPYKLSFYKTDFNDYFRIKATTPPKGGTAFIARCYYRESGNKQSIEIVFRKSISIIVFCLFWLGASLYGTVYNLFLCIKTNMFSLELGISILMVLIGVILTVLMNSTAKKNVLYFKKILEDILE